MSFPSKWTAVSPLARYSKSQLSVRKKRGGTNKTSGSAGWSLVTTGGSGKSNRGVSAISSAIPIKVAGARGDVLVANSC